MTTNVGSAYGEINIDVGGIERAERRANTLFGRIEQRFTQVGSRMRSVGQRIENSGAGAARALGQVDNAAQRLQRSFEVGERSVQRFQQRFTAIGRSGGFVEQTFQTVAQAVSNAGGSASDLDVITKRLIAISKQSRITQEDIRRIGQDMPELSNATQRITVAEDVDFTGKQFFDQIVQELNGLNREYEEAATTAAAAAARSSQSLSSIEQVIETIRRRAQAARLTMVQFLSAVEQRARLASQSLGRIGQNLDQAGGRLTTRVTASLLALGAASLKFGSDLERSKRALEGVEGSAAGAARRIERLEQIAKQPGLGFEQAIQGYVRLRNVRLEAGLSERALAAFGNAIARAGGTGAQLDGVTLALTQIASKGKVSAEEINQIAERVPQIRAAMLDAFGTADTEVIQGMGIEAEEFIAAIVAQLEMLPPAVDGAFNSIENTGVSVRRFLAGLYDSFDRTFDISGILNRVIGFLDGARIRIEQLTQTNPQLVRMGFIIGGIAIAAGPVLIALGSLVSIVAGAASGLATLAAIATGPVGIGLAAVAVAIYAFATNAGGARDRAIEFADALAQRLGISAQTATGQLAALAGFLAGFASSVAGWGVGIVNQIASGMISAVGAVVDAINYLAGMVAYWLQPQSPPRAMPHIDRWGKETAEVYLNGWRNARTDAIRQFGADVGSLLQQVMESGGVAADAERINALFQQALDAPNGSAAEAIFEQISQAAGVAGDEIAGLARAYVGLVSAEKQVAAAGSQLGMIRGQSNSIISSFTKGGRKFGVDEAKALDNLLRPLAKQEERAVAAVQRARADAAKKRGELGQKRDSSESGLEKELQSLTSAVTALKSGLGGVKPIIDEQTKSVQLQQAELRDIIRLAQLEEIINDENATQAERQLAALEKQEIILRRQKRATEADELGIDLSELEKIVLTEEDLGKQREKQLTTQEKQLKAAQLQRAELNDIVRLAQLDEVMNDKSATAAERKAAALERAEIAARRAARADQAGELGVDLSELEQIALTDEDIGKQREKQVNQLEKQLKIAQLQQAEMRDLVRLAQLDAVLNDENATAAQKRQAALEKQTIELQRQQRLKEAQELGASLDDLKDIEITEEDIGKQRAQQLGELEKQARAIQLQEAELRDTRRLAEINNRLTEDGVSAEERKRLELEKQGILLSQQQRARENQELGLGIDLQALRDIPIVIEDAEKKVNDLGNSWKDAGDKAEEGATKVERGLQRAEDIFGEKFDVDPITATMAEVKRSFDEGRRAWEEFLDKLQNPELNPDSSISKVLIFAQQVGGALDTAMAGGQDGASWLNERLFGGRDLVKEVEREVFNIGRAAVLGWRRASAELPPWLESQSDGIKNWLENAKTGIINWLNTTATSMEKGGVDFVDALRDGLIERSIVFANALGSLMQDGRQRIEDSAEKWRERGDNLVYSLNQGVVRTKQFFTDTVGETIEGGRQWIEDSAEKWRVRGDNLVLALNEGAERTRESFVTTVGGVARAGRDKIDSFKEQFQAKGRVLIGSAKAGAAQRLDAFVTGIGDIIIAGRDKVAEFKDGFIEQGKALVDGIIEGLWAKAGQLYGAVRNLIQNAIGAGEDESGTNSPSKVTMRRWGMPWVEGAELGIEKRLPVAIEKARDAVRRIVESGTAPLGTLRDVVSEVGGVAVGGSRPISTLPTPLPILPSSRGGDRVFRFEVDARGDSFGVEERVRRAVDAAVQVALREAGVDADLIGRL